MAGKKSLIMERIEAGDTVVFKERQVLKVLQVLGERALCSFQASDKPHAGGTVPGYIKTYEDLFPLSELRVIKKAT